MKNLFKKVYEDAMQKSYNDIDFDDLSINDDGPEIAEPEVDPQTMPGIETEPDENPRFNPFRPEFPENDPTALPQPRAERLNNAKKTSL